jgi:hypothetical protein
VTLPADGARRITGFQDASRSDGSAGLAGFLDHLALGIIAATRRRRIVRPLCTAYLPMWRASTASMQRARAERQCTSKCGDPSGAISGEGHVRAFRMTLRVAGVPVRRRCGASGRPEATPRCICRMERCTAPDASTPRRLDASFTRLRSIASACEPSVRPALTLRTNPRWRPCRCLRDCEERTPGSSCRGHPRRFTHRRFS